MKKVSVRFLLLAACALLFFGMAKLPDSRQTAGEAEGAQETNFYTEPPQTQEETTVQEEVQEIVPCCGQPETKAAMAYLRENVPLPQQLQQYIYMLCLEKNIRYELVLSVIYQESRFEADAEYYNTDGTVDRGLMQINSSNNYSAQTLFDPFENTRIGIFVIADKIARYGELYGLMAYKMGDYGMEKARSEGTINTKYADKILVKQMDFQ